MTGDIIFFFKKEEQISHTDSVTVFGQSAH